MRIQLLILLLATCLPVIGRADWPTTKWEIICLPPGDGGDPECRIDSAFSQDTHAQLTGAGSWLEGLGYKAPTLTRRGFVTDDSEPLPALMGAANVCDGRLAACYDLERYGFLPNYWSLKKVGIDYTATLGMDTLKIGTLVRDNPARLRSAPTHELYHAIQSSYGLKTNMERWMWFIEGTAAAVEIVHYDANYDTSERVRDRFGNLVIGGRGYYDYPLDQLKNAMFKDPSEQVYTSYHFWKFVGESLSAGDAAMGLRMLLDALSVTGDPVAGIDSALETLGRGGLEVHYPEFVAKRANEPQDFEKLARTLRVFDGNEEDKKDEKKGSVQRLAAQFHLVTADPREGEDVKLEIRLEGDDSLHLIVDDTRYDGKTGSSGNETNVYRTKLEEEKEFKVRVANVADDAASTSDQNYTLKARLLTEKADCCSCAFDATSVFPASGDFQCSFAYPAHWEAQFDPWDNIVYVKAPRCKERCKGARSMSFSISKGRDNNAEVQEREALGAGATTVGTVSCGGRKSIVFQPPGTSPAGRSGAVNFHVGKHDDRAYDARAQFSCPPPGEWMDLRQLFLDSVK